MTNGMKWTEIERAEFLNELVAICEISMQMLNITRHARNYMIGNNEITEVLSCDAYGYKYEFDKNLGCYRFKWNKEGPWTRWRSIEEAA